MSTQPVPVNSLLDTLPLPSRPATQADIPYLLDLRHRTMDRHLQAHGLAPSEEEYLARVTLHLDHARILLCDSGTIGLFKLVASGTNWELVQIQLEPQTQGQGLGDRLLGWTVGQARLAGASVALSVFKLNPALRLYQRHGFVLDQESEHTFEMIYPGLAES